MNYYLEVYRFNFLNEISVKFQDKNNGTSLISYDNFFIHLIVKYNEQKNNVVITEFIVDSNNISYNQLKSFIDYTINTAIKALYDRWNSINEETTIDFSLFESDIQSYFQKKFSTDFIFKNYSSIEKFRNKIIIDSSIVPLYYKFM